MLIRFAAAVAGLAVVSVILLLLMLPVSSRGVECGTAISAVHHEKVSAFTDSGGLFYPLQNPQDAPSSCGAAVDWRRTAAIVVGVAAVVIAGAVVVLVALHHSSSLSPRFRWAHARMSKN